MPLFGNKFTPKKTPARRAQSLSNLNLDADQSRQEFGVDGYTGVKLNLGGQEVAFENGMWVTGMLDCSLITRIIKTIYTNAQRPHLPRKDNLYKRLTFHVKWEHKVLYRNSNHKLHSLFHPLSMSPWWSLCTLYLLHARWSYRRRLGSLLLWACVQCVASIVRVQLLPIVC